MPCKREDNLLPVNRWRSNNCHNNTAGYPGFSAAALIRGNGNGGIINHNNHLLFLITRVNLFHAGQVFFQR